MVSRPVPVSVAVNVGSPVEEFVTRSVPLRMPAPVGVKVTEMVHVPLAAIETEAQVFAETA